MGMHLTGTNKSILFASAAIVLTGVGIEEARIEALKKENLELTKKLEGSDGERLSSGQKIVKAGDDTGQLGIGIKLQSKEP